jgi:hypothetical protein
MPSPHKDRTRRSGGTITKVVDVTTPMGEVQWRISRGGKTQTLRPNKRSRKSIDETTATFAVALARLADS